MMKLPYSLQMLVVALLLAVAASGVYGFFLSRIAEINRSISATSNELERESLQEERLNSARGLLKETQAKRETLNAFFVASDGVVGFIESVESLGNRAGVAIEITGVSIEALPTPRRGSELLRLSVRADGDFKSVFYFFTLLESLPAPLEFERVSLEGSEGAWSGVFSFTVIKKT